MRGHRYTKFTIGETLPITSRLESLPSPPVARRKWRKRQIVLQRLNSFETVLLLPDHMINPVV
jgi:hypothetical protein